MPADLSPDSIRAARAEKPQMRARDFAAELGIPEAQLVSAYLGVGTIRVDPTPDRLVPALAGLGDVLALTRNENCVHERHGVYANYQGGPHASMVLGSEIDLRIFPLHWAHAFAVEEQGDQGLKRSLQIFDAAGDAVHKIHLTAASDQRAFDRLVADLRLEDVLDGPDYALRKTPETGRADPARADELRDAWDKMTDTHQFLRLVHRLKMNRLGAYRVVGEPWAVRLDRDSVTLTLTAAAEQKIPVMIFVGNHGCIQIHGGPIANIVPMGPWINVMDPRFNLHLRADRIAEVWCVTKPTRTGDAISVEAFSAEGELILQIFGLRKDAEPVAWNRLTAELPRMVDEVSA